jgi:hypothetical protein
MAAPVPVPFIDALTFGGYDRDYEDFDEQLQLARALSLSLEAHPAPAPVPSEVFF